MCHSTLPNPVITFAAGAHSNFQASSHCSSMHFATPCSLAAGPAAVCSRFSGCRHAALCRPSSRGPLGPHMGEPTGSLLSCGRPGLCGVCTRSEPVPAARARGRCTAGFRGREPIACTRMTLHAHHFSIHMSCRLLRSMLPLLLPCHPPWSMLSRLGCCWSGLKVLGWGASSTLSPCADQARGFVTCNLGQAAVGHCRVAAEAALPSGAPCLAPTSYRRWLVLLASSSLCTPCGGSPGPEAWSVANALTAPALSWAPRAASLETLCICIMAAVWGPGGSLETTTELHWMFSFTAEARRALHESCVAFRPSEQAPFFHAVSDCPAHDVKPAGLPGRPRRPWARPCLCCSGRRCPRHPAAAPPRRLCRHASAGGPAAGPGQAERAEHRRHGLEASRAEQQRLIGAGNQLLAWRCCCVTVWRQTVCRGKPKGRAPRLRSAGALCPPTTFQVWPGPLWGCQGGLRQVSPGWAEGGGEGGKREGQDTCSTDPCSDPCSAAERVLAGFKPA